MALANDEAALCQGCGVVCKSSRLPVSCPRCGASFIFSRSFLFDGVRCPILTKRRKVDAEILKGLVGSSLWKWTDHLRVIMKCSGKEWYADVEVNPLKGSRPIFVLDKAEFYTFPRGCY